MALRARRPRRQMKKAPRRARQFRGRRLPRSNRGQSQVFSETYKAGTECFGVNATGQVNVASPDQGVGIKLLTQMNRVAQVGSYKTLWRSYKILKAKFTIIPKWTGETFNEASIATAGAIGITETPRFAQSINDMDQVMSAPLTELDVLQSNGCRVKLFKSPVSISVRPKPLIEQIITGPSVTPGTTVNAQQKSATWLEFDDYGTLVPHVGVDGQFSAINSLSAGFLALADIQVTVSFVCKDPR